LVKSNQKIKQWLEVASHGNGATTLKQIIFGHYGRTKLCENALKTQELPMSTVALIDIIMNETIKLVETNRVQYTIDQLMRNRDPHKFMAKEVNNS
jgi:hypothetical protein